jgi:hypothetical protein
MKHWGAEILFQTPDLLADRGLTDAKLLGCPRKIPLLCHCKEVADMAQLHRYLQKLLHAPV